MKPKFAILDKYGVISTSRNGSTLELRKVSWFGKKAKFDIRNWDGEELARSSAKLTLTEEEAFELYKILSKIFSDSTEGKDLEISDNDKELPKLIEPFNSNLVEELDEGVNLVISPNYADWD